MFGGWRRVCAGAAMIPYGDYPILAGDEFRGHVEGGTLGTGPIPSGVCCDPESPRRTRAGLSSAVPVRQAQGRLFGNWRPYGESGNQWPVGIFGQRLKFGIPACSVRKKCAVSEISEISEIRAISHGSSVHKMVRGKSAGGCPREIMRGAAVRLAGWICGGMGVPSAEDSGAMAAGRGGGMGRK
jgi:hypothetical protein